jgi:anti-sigma regulatory factor (Ser/Thr protein kinase)
MKLDIQSPAVEKSAEFEEQFFGVGNLAVVLTILRSKLYSNPIKIVVQEILSNARDAHREAGKEDVPIQVTLPTAMNPNFEVKDFGVGITPERMSNVFLQYGMSTKRDDNVQTGGFGLGAKSPFSYTDSFVIESVTEKTKRIYVAYIDETSVGKMSLLSSEPTEESNGVTIKIPVKESDFYSFRTAFTDITTYWDVRPEVEGVCLYYPDIDSYLKRTENFWLTGDEDVLRILIDKIPYTMTKYTLLGVDFSKYPEVDYEKILQTLSFGVGFETPCGLLSVAANREQIELSEKNLRIIFKNLTQISGKILDLFNKELQMKKNYFEAVSFCKSSKIFNAFNENFDFLWNGIKIPKDLTYDFKNDFAQFFCYKVNKRTTTYTKKTIERSSLHKPVVFILEDIKKQYRAKLEFLRTQTESDFIYLVPKIQVFGQAMDKAALTLALSEIFEAYGGFAENENNIYFLSEMQCEKKTPTSRKSYTGLKRYVKYLNSNFNSQTQDLEKLEADPEVKVLFVPTRYSVITYTPLHKTYPIEREIDVGKILIKRLHSLIPPETQKIVVFGCSVTKLKKYLTPENDFFAYIQKQLEKTLPKFVYMQLFSRTFIENKHWLGGSYHDCLATLQHFIAKNTVKNKTIHNVFLQYYKVLKYFYAADLHYVLREIPAFFELPEINESFGKTIQKLHKKFPMLDYICNGNTNTESLNKLTSDLSEYFNLKKFKNL